MSVPWTVVRDPSAAKRAAESGKACGITGFGDLGTVKPRFEEDGATKPLISFDSRRVWAAAPVT